MQTNNCSNDKLFVKAREAKVLVLYNLYLSRSLLVGDSTDFWEQGIIVIYMGQGIIFNPFNRTSDVLELFQQKRDIKGQNCINLKF